MSIDDTLNDFMTYLPELLRIGGEFEFNLDAYTGEPHFDPDAGTASMHCLWVDTGRSALFVAAQTILHLGGKARVWLPAYGCESISRSFRQAGFDLKYYPVGAPLTGSDVCLPQPEVGESLLFIHYFGHRNGNMTEVARQYRATGVWVIEDCVQASLTKGAEICGNFSVTSFRKVLPVPDGAMLLSGEPVNLSKLGMELAEPDEAFVSAKLIAKLMRGSGAAAEEFLPLVECAESRLDDRIVPRRMSWLSRWMMSYLDQDEVITKRRANWLVLSKWLRTAGLAKWLRPVFDTLGDDDVPLGLPVCVVDGQRDNLLRFLGEQEIFCPVHWPLDHLPAGELFLQERLLESSILMLPVDQRMSEVHIERIVHSLISFFRDAL